MANKIINFTNKKTNIDAQFRNILYKDISMTAAYTNSSATQQKIANILDANHIDQQLADDIYTTFLLKYGSNTEPTPEIINNIINNKLYKIDNLINLKAILNSLHNIFNWTPGERILNPEFGSKLHQLLYEGITPTTEELIASEIKQCVTQWEPRIKIEQIMNISNINDTEHNTINMRIIFQVPAFSKDSYYYDFSTQTSINY